MKRDLVIEFRPDGMKVYKVKLPQITCKRCGHTWTPRNEKVTMCPRCKSRYFNEEKNK